MVDRQLTKKQLEIILSKLSTPLQPDKELEQYTIPSNLAAEVLNTALLNGDIGGKAVADFGCGSGRLAIGAALLGAQKVPAVDIDEKMIALAKENLEYVNYNIPEALENPLDIEFVHGDVANFNGQFDTVVQNPPFGMRGEKGADRIFLAKALERVKHSGRIYSLHRGGYEGEHGYKGTREFITHFVESNKGRVLAVKEFKFVVPYMFKFHKKPKVSYNVDLFVIEKV
jgi:putative methylase